MNGQPKKIPKYSFGSFENGHYNIYHLMIYQDFNFKCKLSEKEIFFYEEKKNDWEQSR